MHVTHLSAHVPLSQCSEITLKKTKQQSLGPRPETTVILRPHPEDTGKETHAFFKHTV